jgi:hypothetical protein
MHWVGYDQVYKPASQTQDINVNPWSDYEEFWDVLALAYNKQP